MLTIDDYDYHLPVERIAQSAVTPKDHSKLMVVTDKIEHKHFYDIIEYLNKDDVLVLNVSKVVKAKAIGKRSTGAKVELLLERMTNDTVGVCRMKGTNLKVGSDFLFDDLGATIVGREDELFVVRFSKKITPAVREKYFSLPLPPYVKKESKDDEYQTVYAKDEGSIAAPTAGLHFTEELLKKIEKKGVNIAQVTLHVGAGTFLPVKDDIASHKMHTEYYSISKKDADLMNNRKGRLIAVGTTTVRCLESAAKTDGKIVAGNNKTNIFITEGYQFKNNFAAIITNFHLPKSTLLILVSAYFGREKILNAYKIAIEKKYRFYSLGDAMLLLKQKTS